MPEPASECIFCRIISGQLPVQNKEYEDRDCLVIHDIKPQAPIHLLVIAKNHGFEFDTAPKDILEKLNQVAREMIQTKGLGPAFRVTMNGGEATLVNNHLHIHLLGGVKADRVV
jgi:histidine triad (HIT) family protein